MNSSGSTSTDRRRAIIDIGSNSVRLVVYAGPRRAPATLFNEKVAAGLGKGLSAGGTEGGALDPKAVEQTLRALARYRAVTQAMGVTEVRTVATAAARDASDSLRFLARVRDVGLDIELLSGEAEACGAAHGVLSAFPAAHGIVGDLGGGSLELVRVGDGQVSHPISMPLGVLRLPAIRAGGRGALERHVRKLLARAKWRGMADDLPFYLVGGSWRALARLHMHLTDYPLPILQGYEMPPEAASRLQRAVGRMDRKRLKDLAVVSTSRIASLGDAAALLAVMARILGSRSLVVSAFGLREGLLYEKLDAAERELDPLIEAMRAAGARLGRFPEHGDLLADWIAPLFMGEVPTLARLRRSACLLGDVAWGAAPELRADRGVDIALNGNWVGVDVRGRALVAHALWTSFGGGPQVHPLICRLTTEAERQTAASWGLAMRLGQRLSGGVAGPLAKTRLVLDAQHVTLEIAPEDRVLYGEAVERRHRQMASALGRVARVA